MTKDDLLNLDVSPFTRLVWNSESARRKYEPLIATVASLHDTAEYEMVRQGKRKCGTLHLAPHNFHRIIEKLKKTGWCGYRSSGPEITRAFLTTICRL